MLAKPTKTVKQLFTAINRDGLPYVLDNWGHFEIEDQDVHNDFQILIFRWQTYNEASRLFIKKVKECVTSSCS